MLRSVTIGAGRHTAIPVTHTAYTVTRSIPYPAYGYPVYGYGYPRWYGPSFGVGIGVRIGGCCFARIGGRWR